MAKNKKMYIVLSVGKNYLHGVFPHSEQGRKDAVKYQKKIKKTKEIETYLTESDYMEKHGVHIVEMNDGELSETFCSDEIYNDTPKHRGNSKKRFWDMEAVSFIVDVTIHTVFLVAVFWQ